jgi:hypothetical protein
MRSFYQEWKRGLVRSTWPLKVWHLTITLWMWWNMWRAIGAVVVEYGSVWAWGLVALTVLVAAWEIAGAVAIVQDYRKERERREYWKAQAADLHRAGGRTGYGPGPYLIRASEQSSGRDTLSSGSVSSGALLSIYRALGITDPGRRRREGWSPGVVPDSTTPVIGWRAWTHETGRTELRPTTRHTPIWTPGVNIAECDNWIITGSDHYIAAQGACGCGFYAFKSVDLMWRNLSGAGTVFGAVEMWGAVYEHELGWKASHAKIIGLCRASNRVRDRNVERIARIYGVPLLDRETGKVLKGVNQ